MMSLKNEFKILLKKAGGLLAIDTKVPINDSFALSLIYTPGVGKCCLEIEKDLQQTYKLTNRGNSAAVIFIHENPDINIEAVLPSLELRILFYKEIAKIDAYPLLINNDDAEKLKTLIKNIEPSFSSIEIISNKAISPELEKELTEMIEIPILYSRQTEKIKAVTEASDKFKNNDSYIVNSALLKALTALRPKHFSFTVKESLKNHCENLLNNETGNELLTYSLNLFTSFYDYFLRTIAEESGNSCDTGKLVSEYRKSQFFKAQDLFKQPDKDYRIEDHSIEENSLELHQRTAGVITLAPKVNLNISENYGTLLSPNFLDEISDEIDKNPEKVYDYTSKNNLVLIVSDGSAVLGFGNIGAEASIPVLEGKGALLKKLGGVDSLSIALSTQSPDEIVDIVCSLSHAFGGIHLEDISAPRCFEIENRIIERLDMPVFHDDQHGTAIIVLAGVINALKVAGKDIKDVKIAMSGAGAAALSVAEMLLYNGAVNLTLCDINGSIYKGRTQGMNSYLEAISLRTNPEGIVGSLKDVVKGADLFIGLSAANILTVEMVKSMNDKSCVFALANPRPEIMPELAKEAGAYIVATGRSDFHNQINNSLAFPGVFRGALDVRAKCVNKDMKLAAAKAIASLIPDEELSTEFIIPNALDLRVGPAVAKAIAESAIKTKAAAINKDPGEIYEKLKNFYLEGCLR